MLNFATALKELDAASVMQMTTERRPPSDYLFATVLPEINRSSYTVESGTLTVRATMAGAVGMDSPYPAGGYIEASQFLEETAKLAIDVAIPERTTRELQAWLAQMAGTNTATSSKEAVAREALNFYDKVILQALIDRDEWLRGQALCTGAINWQFNGLDIQIDYGVPAGNKLTPRTIAGTDAYHLAGSGFWADVWAARALLRSSQQVVAMTSTAMIDAILSQSANEIRVLSDDNNVFRLQRYQTIGGNTVISEDTRDRIDLIAYDLEGEVRGNQATEPASASNVPFMVQDRIVWIGSGNNRGYRVGEGSTPRPENRLEVGYTHLAPTVEGGGRPGRWGELFTPERAPWQLRGRAAENSLPVIENPDRIVIAQNELP